VFGSLGEGDASLFFDALEGAQRHVFARMRNGNLAGLGGMFKVVVRPGSDNQHPTVRQEGFDDFSRRHRRTIHAIGCMRYSRRMAAKKRASLKPKAIPLDWWAEARRRGLIYLKARFPKLEADDILSQASVHVLKNIRNLEKRERDQFLAYFHSCLKGRALDAVKPKKGTRLVLEHLQNKVAAEEECELQEAGNGVEQAPPKPRVDRLPPAELAALRRVLYGRQAGWVACETSGIWYELYGKDMVERIGQKLWTSLHKMLRQLVAVRPFFKTFLKRLPTLAAFQERFAPFAKECLDLKPGHGWVEEKATLKAGVKGRGRPKARAVETDPYLRSQELQRSAALRMVHHALDIAGIGKKVLNKLGRASRAADQRSTARWRAKVVKELAKAKIRDRTEMP
jgi:hypothetical protein